MGFGHCGSGVALCRVRAGLLRKLGLLGMAYGEFLLDGFGMIADTCAPIAESNSIIMRRFGEERLACPTVVFDITSDYLKLSKSCCFPHSL